MDMDEAEELMVECREKSAMELSRGYKYAVHGCHRRSPDWYPEGGRKRRVSFKGGGIKALFLNGHKKGSVFE